jgi:hypothetical protein
MQILTMREVYEAVAAVPDRATILPTWKPTEAIDFSGSGKQSAVTD